MQTEPPDGEAPQFAMIDMGQAPLLMVPQAFDVTKGDANGHQVAFLKLTGPLVAMAVMLDQDSAEKLCDELRGCFTNIKIARVVPMGNGSANPRHGG